MLYKLTEWQGASGLYYCSNIDDLGNNSGAWWLMARILNKTPADFLQYLIEEYKPDVIKYNKDTNFLYYGWVKPENCHRLKLFINREARKRNFQI